MDIEELSEKNLKDLTDLVLQFWPNCDFNEEYLCYKDVLNSENEICYLVKKNEVYVAFIHLSIRTNYVEGASEMPIAYIEALYVIPSYQHNGIGEILVKKGENWAIQKGFTQLGSDSELYNSIAIDFHKKLGFEVVNRVVCFIKNIK